LSVPSKVEIEDSDYIRDTKSKAILATNLDEKKRFLLRQKEKQKVLAMEQDINNIKSDLSEIKDLLAKLIEK
tara:strand:+ start:486 stop:701 length:216 start_codon:yes stop_codon:yes gene_type:complete